MSDPNESRPTQIKVSSPDGKLTITSGAEGPAIHHDEELSFDLGRIESISLRNLFDIKSYGVNRVDNRTMHFVEFLDGGTFELTYANGKLEVCRGQQISAAISGNIIIVGQMDR